MHNAIELPWSSGAAEGQINRPKTLKRAENGTHIEHMVPIWKQCHRCAALALSSGVVLTEQGREPYENFGHDAVMIVDALDDLGRASGRRPGFLKWSRPGHGIASIRFSLDLIRTPM
ncbi:MAG: transposase [Rhizobiaceae bacterium]|nr:MAG: transposase [Rhizobiaceae bacterium]